MSRITQPLVDGNAHVWHVSLTGTLQSSGVSLLSSDELERANRFRFTEDRHRFIYCRATLRQILGRYLEMSPEKIRFSYNEFGKPQLEDLHLDRSLRFNVSHTGSICLIAISRGSRIGIDVEDPCRLADVDSLAQTVLSDYELECFQATHIDDRALLFLKLWTCKEALAKADGRGLSIPPSDFEFEFSASNYCRLLRVAGKTEAAGRWSLEQFALTANCAGAVAVESLQVDIKHFNYAKLGNSE